MEALIEDSIEHIVNHEDSQRFIDWMCEHIDDYYTGPDMRQGGLFNEPAIVSLKNWTRMAPGRHSRMPSVTIRSH